MQARKEQCRILASTPGKIGTANGSDGIPDRRLLTDVGRRFPGCEHRAKQVSLIEEGEHARDDRKRALRGPQSR